MHSTTNERAKGLGKRDVVRIAKERDVRFFRLVFADILGVSKSVSLPISELEAALAGNVTFDGGSIDGFVRGEEMDMVLVPDPATFAIYPWTAAHETEARLICDIAMPDGTPFEGCPRTTLRRVLEESRTHLPALTCALEAEFYLFESLADGRPSTRTNDVGSYFDFSANDRGERARTAIVQALREMGIAAGASHHEHGRGQHEIDFAACDPLCGADNILTLRTVAKHVAHGFGLDATFMPKPLENEAGSGLHVDFSFEDGGAEAELPENALYFIAGLLEHAPGCTAVCNSTVNSYKRLVAAWDAPVYTVWSRRSANALVRVPSSPRDGTHVEMRSPDPACNPYLALAVLTASGADGIAQHRLPGDAFAGSTYDLDERERAARGVRMLPGSLREAVGELDADMVARVALGDHIYHAFRDAKIAEYERYRRAVHPWERDAYLQLY